MDISSIQVKIYKYKYWLAGIFVLFFMLVIGWITNQGLDPDFGWHLRMGQDILSKGVPKTDTYSYTMPSYPFVNHEWLTGVVIALVYPFVGTVGLGIIFTTLAFGSLLIQFPLSLKKWTIIPLILSLGTLSTYMGIRAQTLSWVFFSMLLFILFHKKLWNYFRFFLPFLFLVWVNMHAGFPLGLAVFCLFLLWTTWLKKAINIIDWGMFITSIAVTFINPYTYRIWWEVWVTFFDPSIRWSIQEWLPAFFFVNYYLLLLLPLSVVFIFYTRKQFTILEKGFYIVLLLFGISSTRNIPFFLIYAFPLTTRAIVYFKKDISPIPFAATRFKQTYVGVFVCIVILIISQVLPLVFLYKHAVGTSDYPSDAVTYLQKHPSSGNIFAPYGWGGYLIWKLPQKKVFIDGRMPTWRQSNTSTESGNALAESNAILSGKETFLPVVRKYHIDTVLLSASSLHTKKTLTDILSSMLHLNQENYPYFIQQIKALGMKEVYRDKTGVIYRKK